jgi:hypothetical protein
VNEAKIKFQDEENGFYNIGRQSADLTNRDTLWNTITDAHLKRKNTFHAYCMGSNRLDRMKAVAQDNYNETRHAWSQQHGESCHPFHCFCNFERYIALSDGMGKDFFIERIKYNRESKFFIK